ncbi:voltage-gated potassium channel [Trichoderma evansii]
MGDRGDETNGAVADEEAKGDQPDAYLRRTKIENDNAHLEPSRWWFLASVFPMIAGTIAPVASAFSICALVAPWRQHLSPGQQPDQAPYIPDPAWLTAINAVQLAIAVISNLFLLFNMARRVRFSIAQPITIVGWYFSSICLICLTSMGAGPLTEGLDFPVDEMIWSQSFYYGIWSATLYFIVATLMSLTFWGANAGHYPKDFILSLSQRTLMLQTIMVLIYLHVGATVFAAIEGWGFLDTVYWADVTLFTIGFGDFTPQTTLGQALVIPYAIVGIISLGLVIEAVRNLTLDGGKRRVLARIEEKKRRRFVRKIARRGGDEILEPIQEEPGFSREQTDKSISSEFERRKAEFTLMRKIQAKAATRRKWMALGVSALVWLVFWMVGALVFMQAEKRYQDWTYFEAFYFSFIAYTTIGYGNFAPVSNAGRSFFVFWSLMALPTITVLISHAGSTVIKIVRDSTIRLGNVTILPGEDAYLASLKHMISRMTLGKMYKTHYESPNPTMILDAPKNNIKRIAEFMEQLEEDDLSDIERERDNREDNGEDNGEDTEENTGEDSEEETRERGRPWRERAESTATTFTTKVRRSLSRIRNHERKLPTGPDFYFLLISEIQAVAKHRKDNKQYTYSFDEWAWYLKLIGEDEHDPSTHGKAKIKGKKPAPDPGREEVVKWSWVGHRSPLMGSQSESDWILEKLVDRLQESLSAESQRLKAENREARRKRRDTTFGDYTM